MVIAQDWITAKFANKNSTDSISLINASGGSNNDVSTLTNNCDELTGELVIDGYKTKIINLERHEAAGANLLEGGITKLTIKNCPDLEKIDVDYNKLTEINFEGAFPKLKWLDVRRNPLLKEVDLSNLSELEELFLIDNTLITLENLKGLEKVTGLKNADFSGVNGGNGLNFKVLGAYKDAIRNTLGITGELPSTFPTDLATKLGGKSLKDIPSGQTLASLIVNFDSSKNNLQNQLNQAEKERDAAKAQLEAQKDYDTIKAERDQLKQQLAAIKTELGLGDNTTQQQIIDKIKELMGRPTNADHNKVTSHRDILQDENNRLKDGNKENTDTIDKNALINGTQNWGIKLSDKQNQKLQKAPSVKEVETVRNNIIKSEFDRLKDENSSSTKLNIGLGVLAIGSLLILGWVLMKQANLPSTESDKEKKK